MTCTYDELNRLLTRVASTGQTVLQSFTYQYDAVGNVSEIDETYSRSEVPDRRVNLQYDKVYRLKNEVFWNEDGSIGVTYYQYDNAHNRTQKTVMGSDPVSYSYQYNQLNQLESYSEQYSGDSASFDYDNNGNRIKRTRTSALGNEVTDYDYDPDNRLISVIENGKQRTIDILGPDGLKTEASFTQNANYSHDDPKGSNWDRAGETTVGPPRFQRPKPEDCPSDTEDRRPCRNHLPGWWQPAGW